MPYTSVGEKSGLLQAWYPGDKIVPGNPDDLWKHGQWSNNVRILFTWSESTTFDKWIEADIKLQKAFQIVGNEYGLVHRTQPDGYVKDHDDLWIEDSKNETKAMIACSDVEVSRVPQCKHYFDLDHYGFTVSYPLRIGPV